MKYPERKQTFQMTFPDNGFSGLVLKPWGERKRPVASIAPEIQQKVNHIPGIRASVATPSALPGGGQFPVEFVVASTAEPEAILGFVQQIQQKAAASGMFAFPPLIDTKVDQPEVELVMDRGLGGR
jgi:multidrug efflux pump